MDPYGEILSTYRGASGQNVYTYLTDIQESTGTILDEGGAAEAVYTYSDFGEVTENIAPDIDNEICYTGAVYDDTTGLHYLNARYYDPENGRFISQDSYRGELNDIAQWHLYAYCANNPINYMDPSGNYRISTNWTSLIIDTVLTIYAGWWKWSYDVFGSFLKWSFKQYGKKTFSAKLLGAVPKMIGAYSKVMYKIRTAIRHAIGYTIRIGSSTAISHTINLIAKNIRNGKYKNVTYFVTSMCSLGGAISLYFDFLTDGYFDGYIKL